MQQARPGDSASALRSFEKSLEVEPSAETWTGIGAVRAVRGESEAAAEAYRRALELDGAYVPALNFLQMTDKKRSKS